MRNQVFKKLFSVLLALIMVAGLLPASVLAEGEGNADSTPAPTEAVQPTESAEPTTPTETETPEVTEIPEPTPENPAATVEPTQGEPTAEPTDEGVMPANVMPVQANVAARDTSGDDYYRIVHLDCGRKYFDVSYIKGIIDTMYLNGYNQLQLAFGNGGLRFVLDGMPQDLKDAIAQGNKKFYDSTTNELTQAEMTEIISYAKGWNIEIVPLLNMPGHMDGILSSDKYSGYKLSGSEGSLDLNNENAVAFGKKLLSMYVEYFTKQGCKFFNFGADEYGQGIRNPYIESYVAKVSYNQLIDYMNACAEIIENAGMTARCFNDFVCYNGRTTRDLKASVQVCYWSNQWNGSEYNTVDVINNAGYNLINTNQKWYFVPSKAEEYSKATVLANFKTFDVTKFQHITSGYNSSSTTYYEISGGNNVGAMFCVWCDKPSVAVDLSDVKELIAAMADANPTYFTKVTIPNTTVGNATTAENDTVRVTGPNLVALTAPEYTEEIAGIKAVDGRIKAYDVTPSTADSNYTEKAEVRIKIPEGWDKTKVKAFIVEDGTANDIVDGTATDDGWYVFTALHFSVMGIYEKAATTEVGGTIEITKGSTGVITVPGDVTNSVGEIADKTVAEKVEVKPVQQTGETISYSATASTDAGVNGNYVVSNLIDGELNTKYYSGGSQKVGQHVQIDIGAAIQFDTVLVSTPSDMSNQPNDYCTNANVMVSVDGENWTTLGQYTGSSNNKTQTYTNTLEKVRYIRVQITTAKNNWWQLAEIQWGSYKDGTFNRMAASGSVTTEGKTETQVTIKGLKEGTTTVTIDGVVYTIEVKAAELENVVLPINLWITNTGVVPDGWGNGNPEEFTYSDTAGNRRSIYTLKASYSKVNSPNGISLSSILPKVTGTAKSWDGNTYNVTYWKSAYHTAENRQSTDGWTNYSHKGTKFEYIRFYEGSWAYSVDGITWVNIENVGAGATDTDKNQVCIWYRQVTTVTSEVTTEIVDWGPIKYGANQCLLDFAVKYDGTSNRIPNSFPVTDKTIGFDIAPTGNETYYGTDNGVSYRTVYGIAGVETAAYEVYMITLTPSANEPSSSISDYNKYEYKGTEKIAWAKTEADANSTELYKMPNVEYGGEPFLKSVKIYQKQGLLVTYYLRAKQTLDSLTVHYAIQGSETAFYEYNIAVNRGTTFNSEIALDPNQDPNVGGPLLYGKVTNSNNETITVSSELATLQGLEPQYRYSKYEIVDFRKDDKNVWIYYTFTREHTYVIDFGLPLKIKFSDFGVTDDAAIDTVSLWKEQIVHENKGLYGTAKVITGSTEGKYVLYTLDKPLDKNITIPLYVKFSQKGDNDKPQLFTANIIPATSVYYEDSFAKFYGSDGKEQTGFSKTNEVTAQTPGVWYIDGQEKTANQALEALGQENHKPYGYDPAYDKCTMFSMGSARKVTVNTNGEYAQAKFTFKGTGFDVISLTNNKSGAITVEVLDSTGRTAYTTANKKAFYLVNNYYGYTYNSTTGEWTASPEIENALYQVPVIRVRDLEYGQEYTAVITVDYADIFNKTGDGKYSFWLDAVRVYDPAGPSLNTEYVKDKEGYPQYIKLRDELAKEDGSVTVDSEKLLFIDGAENAAISLYKNYGPNNEVYLAKGQAITFKLAGTDLSKIETVQIGAKAPMSGGIAKLSVNGTGVVEKELSSATEMYYDISAVKDGRIVTITNTGEAILSLTNLKITYTEKGSVSLGAMNAEEQTASVMAVRALFAPAPVEPEPEPEPEKTFEPERFEASWSRNVMQGRKATLTVKTSEDVEAITVDGQTIRSYRTRTERMGFGRRAKRITYREFTYSMVAQESADFSVTAINAEGTESEAITARLTVQKRPRSIRDVWNWFKGWF